MARRLSKREWMRTAYADTQAKHTEVDMQRLFDKYGVKHYTMGQATGPSGRIGFMVRFELAGHTYRLALEILDCPEVPEDQRLAQLKRAIYYKLKSDIETGNVFFGVDSTLFAFRELPGGKGYTMRDLNVPQLLALAEGRTPEGPPLLPHKKE